MVLLVSIEYLQKVSVGFLHFLRVTILVFPVVVMKSTFWSMSHFMSSALSTVHTLTFSPRSWASLIHSGCFLITPM